MRAHELIAASVFAVVLALCFTWPLALELGQVLPHDPRFQPETGSDMHIWVWDFWWARQVVETGAAPFYSRAIFAPEGHSLALHTHAFLWGLLSVPLQWAFGLPAALNLTLLALFALAALAAYALARDLCLERGAAALAAAAWAFSPYFLQKSLEHLCYTATPWPPLLALCLRRWWLGDARGSARWAALGAGLVGGLCLLSEPVTSVYVLGFGLVLLALRPGSLGCALAAEHAGPLGEVAPSAELRAPPVARQREFGGLRDGRAWILGASAALLLALPWWWEALQALRSMDAQLARDSGLARAQLYHPRLADFATWPGLHPWGNGWGSSAPDPALGDAGLLRPENAGLHLAWLAWPFVLVALWLVPAARAWAAVGALFFALAWDPGPQPSGWLSSLYRSWGPLEGLRVPARAFPIAHLVFALLAAAGWQAACLRVARLAARGESRVARRSARSPGEERERGAAPAAFLAAQQGPTSATPPGGRAQGRSSDVHRGPLAHAPRAHTVSATLFAAALLWPSCMGRYPTMDWHVPDAVARLAETNSGGLVLVLPFQPGAYASMSWQTVHQRPVLVSYVARTDPARLVALRAACPDLFDLATGARAPDAEALARDLDVAGASDLLVPLWELATPEVLCELLDRVPGWQRVATADDLAWWRRVAAAEVSPPEPRAPAER